MANYLWSKWHTLLWMLDEDGEFTVFLVILVAGFYFAVKSLVQEHRATNRQIAEAQQQIADHQALADANTLGFDFLFFDREKRR